VDKAKTKGGGANIGQIAAFLGPQFKGTELIATSGDNIYQAEGDLDPEVFGFIIGNFLEGMSPLEFFWHAMAAREGMVDTSIKTAEPGTLTRQLIKTFEDVMVNHDQTIRLSGGPIIQSIYGETRFNPEHLINVDFPDGTIPFFIDVQSVANRLNSDFYQRTVALDTVPTTITAPLIGVRLPEILQETVTSEIPAGIPSTDYGSTIFFHEPSISTTEPIIDLPTVPSTIELPTVQLPITGSTVTLPIIESVIQSSGESPIFSSRLSIDQVTPPLIQTDTLM
jgi:hypothetical protein